MEIVMGFFFQPKEGSRHTCQTCNPGSHFGGLDPGKEKEAEVPGGAKGRQLGFHAISAYYQQWTSSESLSLWASVALLAKWETCSSISKVAVGIRQHNVCACALQTVAPQTVRGFIGYKGDLEARQCCLSPGCLTGLGSGELGRCCSPSSSI